MTRKIRSSTSRSRDSRHVLHRKDYLFMIAAETRCVVASLDLNVSQSSTPMSIFSSSSRTNKYMDRGPRSGMASCWTPCRCVDCFAGKADDRYFISLDRCLATRLWTCLHYFNQTILYLVSHTQKIFQCLYFPFAINSYM